MSFDDIQRWSVSLEPDFKFLEILINRAVQLLHCILKNIFIVEVVHLHYI